MIKKPSRVVFVNDKLADSFNELKDNDPVKKSIINAIRNIKEDVFSGIQIPKRLFPKEYVLKYKINNLWKYDLVRGWRLIYTVTAYDEVKIIAAILDWSDHKRYERMFNY